MSVLPVLPGKLLSVGLLRTFQLSPAVCLIESLPFLAWCLGISLISWFFSWSNDILKLSKKASWQVSNTSYSVISFLTLGERRTLKRCCFISFPLWIKKELILEFWYWLTPYSSSFQSLSQRIKLLENKESSYVSL